MTTNTAETVVLTKKSGKGLRHGVVSEVSAYFHVRPGHTEELRAAIERFQAKLRQAPPQLIQRFGLQDMRHVVFDNGTRLNWATSFETDWQPYIDDSVQTTAKLTPRVVRVPKGRLARIDFYVDTGIQ